MKHPHCLYSRNGRVICSRAQSAETIRLCSRTVTRSTAHAKEVHDVWESMPHHTKQILTCLWLIQMPRRLKGVERIRGLETSRSSSPRGKIQNRDQKQQLLGLEVRSSGRHNWCRLGHLSAGRDKTPGHCFTFLCLPICVCLCACMHAHAHGLCLRTCIIHVHICMCGSI